MGQLLGVCYDDVIIDEVDWNECTLAEEQQVLEEQLMGGIYE